MRRSLLKPFLLFLPLSLLAFYLLSSISFPNPNPNPKIPLHLSTPSTGVRAPKIYLYDLPCRFTYGVIQSYDAARGARESDPSKYPGHQHSGEWFLFEDLSRVKRAGSPLQRVLDPEEADCSMCRSSHR